MSGHDQGWPGRLRNDATTTGAALREYQQGAHPADDEPAAYARVMARIERPRSRRRPWWTMSAGAAAVSAAVVLALHPWSTRMGVQRAPLARTMPTSPVVVPEPARSVTLGPSPVRLIAGRLDLGDGVVATLSANSKVTARRQQGTLDLTLEDGTAFVQAAPRPIGHAVLVNAADYRFTVVGTAFRLSKRADELRLSVMEGLVTVSRGGDHVATVAALEDWSGQASAAPEPRQPTPRLARRPAPAADCTKFTGEQTKEKIACYRELVRKGGPAGERAQHALARYLRDDVVDLDAALAAFEAQRVHYPRGELRADADRAIIEILPRLGRHAEALVETQSFLDEQPEADDRAEMRLLRGDIYRAIFQDVMSAEREYEEGAEAGGRTGDDSRFLRALCLEALGRTDEARLAYRDYLSQSGAVHAREAQRRMQRLATP